MSHVSRRRRPRPPLDRETLQELALAYVGRFATTRAKLRTYLDRKLRERGWDDAAPPDTAGLADRFAAQGYVDDAAFALSRSRALGGRGYGPARVEQALRAAGVADADGEQARTLAAEEAEEAALRFARRRRIGPFASNPHDPKARERALGAMLRAGHSFDLARAVLDLPRECDESDLAELLKAARV